MSYATAIDVWLTIGMCFLFGALLEFAFVNSMARKERMEALVFTNVAKGTPTEIDVYFVFLFRKCKF